MAHLQSALFMPFLYPSLFRGSHPTTSPSSLPRQLRNLSKGLRHNQASTRRCQSSLAEINASRRAAAYEPDTTAPSPKLRSTHLDPTPDDYSRSMFTDKCTILIQAGSGGNGCAAFLREAHIPDGPANGGDGGNGGSVYIKAVRGHTSLHKLARQGSVKAARGQGGQGKSQGGRRGEDVCIEVPVGTIVREVERSDPAADEAERLREFDGVNDGRIEGVQRERESMVRDKWIVYPGTTPKEAKNMPLPKAPRPRKSALSMLQPTAPITLDLAEAMEKPMLLAAGGVGGLGNPHFVTREDPKPKVATKGEMGVRIKLELELKLLADVGLVGLPNAGKSTLVRAVSASRTRIGDWQFTTLSPSIGTVVLDDHKGRVNEAARKRESFTIADIPGLVEDAHLDRGLGIGFLRHVERARILAFVIDLSAGDAVQSLKSLWREAGEYEVLRNQEIAEETEMRRGSEVVEWQTFGSTKTSHASGHGLDGEGGMIIHPRPSSAALTPSVLPPISSKPWFVVATKADLPGTQEQYQKLAAYVKEVEDGKEVHPSGKMNAWRGSVGCIPISAITEGAGGVERVKIWAASLMDFMGV